MILFFKSFAFVWIFLAVLLFIWGVGMWFNLPFLIWWFDIPLHFAGGFWVFLFSRALIKKLNLKIDGQFSGLAYFIWLIGAVALIGVSWEFTEFIGDRFIFKFGFTYLPKIFEDTLLDLLMDLLGGVLGWMLYRRYD